MTTDKTLRRLHFKPLSDPFLYSRWVREKLHLILVYLDDILIASEDEDYISEIKKGICEEYDMTDMMGSLTSISQTLYCLEALKSFDFLVQKEGQQRVHYPSIP
jgi:hypothetical protein